MPPSVEELAHGLAMLALIELLPQEGEIGQAARQEARRLGIDVKAKYQDIRRIVSAKFRGTGLDPEDLLQDVLIAILKRNSMPRSAYDPQKATFGTYVHMIAAHVVHDHLQRVKRRQDHEGRLLCVDDEAPFELADTHDPIAAYDHVRDSMRVSRARPLDRAKIDAKRAVLN